MPSGFLRTASTVRGGVITTEKRPVRRLVSLRAPPSNSALQPAHLERAVGGAHHAGHLDGDGLAADLGEGIVVAGVLVERDRRPVGDEVVGLEPVLAHHHGIDRQRAHVVDEARQVEGDLRVARPVGLRRRPDRARAAARIDLDDVGRGRARTGRATAGSPPGSARAPGEPSAISRQLCACTRALPMRSSQTWAAFW